MSDNTHVPDKLEGYMLQVRHALYELICLDERVVSVEAYDDVAVEKEGLLIAEQTKRSFLENNLQLVQLFYPGAISSKSCLKICCCFISFHKGRNYPKIICGSKN